MFCVSDLINFDVYQRLNQLKKNSKFIHLHILIKILQFQYEENGFAVIEDFFTESETNELRLAGLKLSENAPETDRKTFHASTNESNRAHLKDNYFLDSATKIHYFYENGALDANGNLLVEQHKALNKVSRRVDSATLKIEKPSKLYLHILISRLDMRFTNLIQYLKNIHLTIASKKSQRN